VTPQQFIAKWSRTELTERQASQEFFVDLCRVLGQPTPAEGDPTGQSYSFEKGTPGVAGSIGAKGHHGFADVWKRGHFAWEFKRKGVYKTLDEAYDQLCRYREVLENPPLLVVCDIERIQIHTNFTGTVKRVREIPLKDLGSSGALKDLRAVFEDPAQLRPVETPANVTEQVAAKFAELAQRIQARVKDPQVVAHFLMQCMFALFAEDVKLLPKDLFKRTLETFQDKPKELTAVLSDLFSKMRTGGHFGADVIAWFNGGLFDDAPALEMTRDEIGVMLLAAKSDWSSVEPAIFGTLFERSLDPQKRSQIGAHYTSREDIMLVVEPVVLEPLRREWAAVQRKIEEQLDRRKGATTEKTKKAANKAIDKQLRTFVERLSAVRILDPACGSGNFLYVAIQQLLDLEKEVVTFAARPDVSVPLLPNVRPTQLHGIEISPYAAELAQVVIWIGYLQWMRDNGFLGPRDPILEPLKTIECRDAILDLSDPKKPKPAEWPEADFIIGNPPFLGSKLFRKAGLSDEFISALHLAYQDLPRTVDFCCYWFELARSQIVRHPATRCGLLATQGIRGTDNRSVIERLVAVATIFAAWSDHKWTLDGAAVRVSIICFSGNTEARGLLDGRPITHINADLSSGADLTRAARLRENRMLAFVGACKKGSFDMTMSAARTLLVARGNPRSVSNSDVVRRWINGVDLVRRPDPLWIVDFGVEENEGKAALHQAPFAYVTQHVRPEREQVRAPAERRRWWMLARPAPEMRDAIAGHARFIAVPQVSKHRVFVWVSRDVLPSHQATVIARDDDYMLGVLSSAPHVLWSLELGTQLESRPRYTPTTCFETFPMPWPPGLEPTSNPRYKAIADAARELNELRERWLNPPEWINPIAKHVDATDDFSDVPAEARPLIRHSAIMAAAAKDPKLKKRTLTNLYNERPMWLQLAHERLDRAVLAAYLSVDPSGGWTPDWAEVWKDTGAGQPLPDNHPLAARRAEVDQAVLTALVRLNLQRHSRDLESPSTASRPSRRKVRRPG